MTFDNIRNLTLTLAGLFIVVYVVLKGELSGEAAIAIAIGFLAGGPGTTVTRKALHSLDANRVQALLADLNTPSKYDDPAEPKPK